MNIHRLKPFVLLSVVGFLFACAGCDAAANASHVAKAEAVMAMHSVNSTAATPFVFPDNSSTEVRDDSLVVETGSRLPGDLMDAEELEGLLDKLHQKFISLESAAAVDIKYALDTKPLDQLVSLPKEEPLARKDLEVQCRGPMCNMNSAPPQNVTRRQWRQQQSGGGTFADNHPVAYRVTHPFGGRGIPIVRWFRNR